MRKFITTALAALTAAGAVVAAAVPADARDYDRHGYSYGHHHGGSNTAAIAAVAGIAGLAIGAALSDSGKSRSGYSSSYSYDGYGYRNGYGYDPRSDSYYGGYDSYPRDRVCITRERVWDPYIGRNVSVERRYPC